MVTEPGLVLLSDQPVAEDGQQDLLDRSQAARQLAELIRASRASAPFTLAVYADWGMGKSSLLSQVRAQFDGAEDVRTVWFNAWTAGRGDALETLIKSVLGQLDPNALRRLARRFGGGSRTGAWIRVLMHGMAGTVRLHPLVDEIWRQLEVDSRARNEARDELSRALRAWTAGDGRTPSGRMIVVFVDDLDRCAPEVIRTVCDAVKQYLSVPGLVFVLGCDRAVIESSVAEPGRPAAVTATIGRRYLEKIVQASYLIPDPTDRDAQSLVEGYARQSGTEALFQGAVAAAVVRHARRNPRRIKRLINRFVVEYRLDAQWQQFGADALIRVILLQDFYPEFYELLARVEEFDPIDEFVEYTRVRVFERDDADEDHRENAARFLGRHGLPEHALQQFTDEPAGSSGFERLRDDLLARAERDLPQCYLDLAHDKTFANLVDELAETAADEQFRAKLRRRAVAPIAEPPLEPADEQDDALRSAGLVDWGRRLADETDLSGLDILWIYSRAPTDSASGAQVARRGGRIRWVSSGDEAVRALAARPPDAVISNLWREDDAHGGFQDLEQVRAAGYVGPIIIYTGYVSSGRHERALRLDARITTSWSTFESWLVRLAMRDRGGSPSVLVVGQAWSVSVAAMVPKAADVVWVPDIDAAAAKAADGGFDIVLVDYSEHRPESLSPLQTLRDRFDGPIVAYRHGGFPRSEQVEAERLRIELSSSFLEVRSRLYRETVRRVRSRAAARTAD